MHITTHQRLAESSFHEVLFLIQSAALSSVSAVKMADPGPPTLMYCNTEMEGKNTRDNQRKTPFCKLRIESLQQTKLWVQPKSRCQSSKLHEWRLVHCSSSSYHRFHLRENLPRGMRAASYFPSPPLASVGPVLMQEIIHFSHVLCHIPVRTQAK